MVFCKLFICYVCQRNDVLFSQIMENLMPHTQGKADGERRMGMSEGQRRESGKGRRKEGAGERDG